jgi:hypothetical protein
MDDIVLLTNGNKLFENFSKLENLKPVVVVVVKAGFPVKLPDE